MNGSKWYVRTEKKIKSDTQPRHIPKGMWDKCPSCSQVLYKEELEGNLFVCPKCQYHFRLSSKQRLDLLLDPGTFKEINAGLKSGNPLGFVTPTTGETYDAKIKATIEKTGLNDAVVTGTGKVEGIPVVIAVMDFKFFGGSMGSVVGEKITRAAERALRLKIPFVMVSTSGGARMQEGVYSLMQMAKTSAALELLNQARIPFISILTDPTTGGVTASFAMLGDVNITEPGALIGFAGARVIEQTIRQKLPKGFQRSEFLEEHGFIDAIFHRKELKSNLAKILSYMTGIRY
jgi:acetyl-CoA carboxylase carboxyl transferase subunit beta